MISFISSWAQQIIFAVIIGVIIQMLLPEGKSKKYIKIVIGVYVLFSVISPVVGKNIDIDLENYSLELETNTTINENNTEDSINEIYTTNLKQDIISKLQNKGYGCESVEIEVIENYEIEKITIKGIYEMKEETENEDKNTVSKVNEVIINDVQIGEKENSIKEQVVKGISQSEEKELKKYLNETYAVKEKNIIIE